MKVKELAKIIRAGWLRRADDDMEIRSFSIDSRELRKDDCFIAIRGQNLDGHKFAARAAGSASCVVLERGVNGLRKSRANVLIVKDTRRALMDIARAVRAGSSAFTIAVTGSFGKTTTKDMLAAALRPRFKVNASPYTFNNNIGVPLSLAGLVSGGAEVNVLEAGISRKGEMEELSEIIKPDLVCITAIGEAHIEGLGGINGVITEKMKLLSHSNGLRPICVLPMELKGELLKRYRDVKPITFGRSGDCDYVVSDLCGHYDITSVTINGVKYYTGSFDCSVVNGMAITKAVCDILGVPDGEIQASLARFRPPPLRMQKIVLEKNTIIADCYNSSPAACRAALKQLSLLPAVGRRVAVLGSMLELGADSPRLHSEVVKYADSLGLHVLVLVGREFRDCADGFVYFEDADSLIERVDEIVEEGDLVLLKGSRGMALERVLTRLSGGKLREDAFLKRSALLEV